MLLIPQFSEEHKNFPVDVEVDLSICTFAVVLCFPSMPLSSTRDKTRTDLGVWGRRRN